MQLKLKEANITCSKNQRRTSGLRHSCQTSVFTAELGTLCNFMLSRFVGENHREIYARVDWRHNELLGCSYAFVPVGIDTHSIDFFYSIGAFSGCRHDPHSNKKLKCAAQLKLFPSAFFSMPMFSTQIIIIS